MPAYAAYRNLADTAALSTSSPIAPYPISNLQTRQLSTVARFDSTGGTVNINIDLLSVQTIKIIGLLNTNCPSASDKRGWINIQTSTTGVTYTNVSTLFPNDLGNPNLPAAIYGLPVLPLSARYLRIQPSWNQTDNYYEIGRLWVGDCLVVPDGCDAGWELSIRDPGALDDSAGGQYYEDSRSKGRILQMPCSNLPTTLAYGFDDPAIAAADVPSFDDMFMTVGNTGEVIIAHRTDTAIWMRRTAIYGHLTSDSLSIKHAAGGYHSVNLTAIEEH